MKNKIYLLGLTSILLLTSGCRRQCCEHYEPWQCDVVNEDYVHTYGMQVRPQEWLDRGQNGQVVSTLRNGVIVSKNFCNGYLDGETTYTFPHSGATQRVETYANGNLVKDREHYASGAPAKEKEHHTPNAYTLNEWYENGAPKCREKYEDNKIVEGDYYTKNNQVESRINDGAGTRVIRDDYGNLIQIDKFIDGIQVLSTTYYPNGSPKEEIPYRNGMVEGGKRLFNPGGDPSAVEGWIANRKEGVTVQYQNGEKIAEVPYFSGRKNGIEQRYKDGQYIVEEITWQNDQKHGPSYIHYTPDDIRVDWYYKGRLVTKNQYDRYTSP